MANRAITKKISALPTYALNNNNGNLLYSEGGANYQFPLSNIALLSNLGSSEVGKGAAIIANQSGGSIQDHLWDCVTIEQFLTSAAGNVDDALDLAFTYCRNNPCKTIRLGSGKSYQITRNHVVPFGVRIIGDRHGMLSQDGGTSTTSGSTAAIRAANPTSSAFLWYGPTATTWFTCEACVTFSGVVFGAPNQNWNASSKSDIIDYGTCIQSISYLNVLSCVYYGMTNFVVAVGSSIFCENNNGFPMERDFQISECRDVIRLHNNHSNPNVIRPSENMWRCLISNARVFITLVNHDGALLTNNFAFCVKRFVVNTADSTHLGSLILMGSFADQTGCFLDLDVYGDSPIIVSGFQCIGDNASDAGTSTPDADAGYFIFRKSTSGLITPVTISDGWCQRASTVVTSAPPYVFNYQTQSSYTIRKSNLYFANTTAFDNGNGLYIQSTGDVVSGTRRYISDKKYANFIPNPGWAERHPSNSTPLGWGLTNCTVTSSISSTVTSTATGGVITTRFRRLIGSRTYIFTANSVGVSSGVSIIATDSSGVATTYTGTWTRRAEKWYCVITADTTDVYHDITIDVGVSGATLSFDYAAMVAGTVYDYSDNYSELRDKPTVRGNGAYSVFISAGTTHTVYTGYMGLCGSYTLYLSSALVAVTARLIKLTPTSTPTITIMDATYAGANTLTVAWPANGTPTITSSDAITAYLTIVGASYSTTY